MRTFGYGIAVGLLLVSASVAPTQPQGYCNEIPIGAPPVAVAVAPTQPSPTFNLMACASAATDVVVTDPDGRVLECWRGEFRPGDLVRLGPARLTPANALPWEYLRLRPEHALSGFYRERKSEQKFVRGRYASSEGELPPIGLWPTAAAGTSLRLVLFLRKEPAVAELKTIWLPALACVQRGAEKPPAPPASIYTSVEYVTGSTLGTQAESGFSTHESTAIPLQVVGTPDFYTSREYTMGSSYEQEELRYVAQDDFTACVALIEDGRVLGVRRIGRWSAHFDPIQLAPIADTPSGLKNQVTGLVAPKPRLDAAKPVGVNGPVRPVRPQADSANLSSPTLSPGQTSRP